jgi:phosphoglycolate phosphatase
MSGDQGRRRIALQEAAPRSRVRVFFDIDGTLLLTDGAGRVAIRAALERVYGTSGSSDGYSFHGKTDPQIVVELISGAGLEEEEIRRRMHAVWPVYLERLERELSLRQAEDRITVLPGVADLLEALEKREEVSLGLLTGNVEEGARLKLAAAGVTAAFEVGAFGSDSEDRSEVARVALERSRSADGATSRAMVVVGDTPEDIACAHAVGALAVAVATGRHGVEELVEAGADATFADLSDTGRVVDCLLSLSRTRGASAGAAGDGGTR